MMKIIFCATEHVFCDRHTNFLLRCEKKGTFILSHSMSNVNTKFKNQYHKNVGKKISKIVHIFCELVFCELGKGDAN